jgi:hypothetical protein
MPDLSLEDRAWSLRSLTRKATLCWGLLASTAGCSVRIFARVDDPVRAEGVSVALDDHTCDFQDNSDSGDEPTLDLDLVFHVVNDSSTRASIHPDRVSLVIHGRAYPPDSQSHDLVIRPRSQRDFHAHFSYDGDASCANNMSVTTAHVVELDGRELPLKPMSFQPSDQDAD